MCVLEAMFVTDSFFRWGIFQDKCGFIKLRASSLLCSSFAAFSFVQLTLKPLYEQFAQADTAQGWQDWEMCRILER